MWIRAAEMFRSLALYPYHRPLPYAASCPATLESYLNVDRKGSCWPFFFGVNFTQLLGEFVQI
jgi:hypothetical protein